jgi:hypothetical protein
MDYSHSSVFLGDPKIEYDTGNKFILVTQIMRLVLRALIIIVAIVRLNI